MSAIERAIGLVKQNPALAIAGAGVGGVLLIGAVRGRQAEDAAAAEAEPELAQYGPGYGATLTGGAPTGLESDALATQINEGNNTLLGQIGELRDQIAAVRGTSPGGQAVNASRNGRLGVYGIRRPLPALPGQRVKAARAIGRLRTQPKLSGREVAAILMIYGRPRANPPASARSSASALVAWLRAHPRGGK